MMGTRYDMTLYVSKWIMSDQLQTRSTKLKDMSSEILTLSESGNEPRLICTSSISLQSGH